MKRNKYICTTAIQLANFSHTIDICTGTIVTLLPSGKIDVPNSGIISISKSSFNTCFKRYYSDEELDKFDTLRSLAAVAAMQRLIFKESTMYDCTVTCSPSTVAEEAVAYANALIEELKEKCYDL